MKCPYCMKEFDDGQELCPFCGQKVAASPAVASDELVRNEDVPEYMPPVPDDAELIAEESPKNVPEYMPPVPDDAELIAEEPPKKGKALKITLGVLCVVVALVACFFCFKNAIVGFCLRNFSDPVNYLSYVEGKGFGDVLENLFEEKAENQKKYQSVGTITESKLKIADDVSILFGNLNENLEDILYWLDDFSITLDSDVKDNKTSCKVTCSAQGTELLKALIAMDENGEAYLSVPTFSSKYLNLTEEEKELLNFEEILPEDAVLEKMINRYYRIFFENLTDVKGEKGVYLRGDGVEEEAYVLTVRMTEKQLHDILTALVAEAKNDVELQKIYDDFTSAFVKAELLSEEDVEDWEDLIQEAEESLADAKETFEGEGEELFVLADYINSKHEIVGRRITTEQEESFLLAYYKDERDIDFIFTMEGFEVRAAGEVVEDHSSVTGEIVVDSLKAVEWKLNWGDDDLTLRANLTDEMRAEIVKALGGEINLGPFSNYMDLGILLELDVEDECLDSEFSILVSDKKKITITSRVQAGEAERVELPEENDVYSIEKSEEWLETFDFNQFLKALEESGFPMGILE